MSYANLTDALLAELVRMDYAPKRRCGIHGDSTDSGRCESCDRERAKERCGAHYGTGDGTAICGRPINHPPVSEDGIGHSPYPTKQDR